MPVLYARIGGVWTPIGAGANEVEVGPSDPIGTNPAADLWYDTDAPAVLTDDMRWNTAWGTVALGTFSAAAGTSLASNTVLTSPMTLTMLSGRRYWVRGSIGAPYTGANTGLKMTLLHNGSVAANTFAHYVVSGGYPTMTMNCMVNGDGAAHTWTLAVTTDNAATFGYWAENNWFTVEDVGPTSISIPAPNPIPAWLPVQPYLQNGWVDYGAPYGPAFFRKFNDIVFMRGLVQSGTANSVVCTLPSGYRPPYEAIVTVPCFQGNAEIRIGTAGTVSVSGSTPTTAPVATPSTWLSLSGVTFSVS